MCGMPPLRLGGKQEWKNIFKMCAQFFLLFDAEYRDQSRNIHNLSLGCHIDEVLLLAMPKKNGWGGLGDGLQATEVVVSR